MMKIKLLFAVLLMSFSSLASAVYCESGAESGNPGVICHCDFSCDQADFKAACDIVGGEYDHTPGSVFAPSCHLR